MGVGWGFNLKEKDKYLPGYCVMLCESSVNVELVMPWTRSTLQTLGNQLFFCHFNILNDRNEPVCEARDS